MACANTSFARVFDDGINGDTSRISSTPCGPVKTKAPDTRLSSSGAKDKPEISGEAPKEIASVAEFTLSEANLLPPMTKEMEFFNDLVKGRPWIHPMYGRNMTI